MFTKICESRELWAHVCVRETLAVNMNMRVLILMLLFVYVCVGERESLSMTQSNLRWFPLHVW